MKSNESWMLKALTIIGFLMVFICRNPRQDHHVSARSVEGTKSVTSFVVLVTVYGRYPLTRFVLRNLQLVAEELKGDGIRVFTHVVGSEGATSASLAAECNASYNESPNEPLGAKHNQGLSVISEFYDTFDAVVVIGSDDLINAEYFKVIREYLRSGYHIIGLRDVYFYDGESERMMYTRGYHSSRNELAYTVGLGRVFSRSVLAGMEWKLWEADRNRGLDQSAVRNVLSRMPLISSLTISIHGAERGIVAVDVKTSRFKSGRNIWSFDQIVAASSGNSSRLTTMEERDARRVFEKGYREGFMECLGKMIEEFRAASEPASQR